MDLSEKLSYTHLKEELSSLTPWQLMVGGLTLVASSKVIGYISNYCQYLGNKSLIREKQAKLSEVKADWARKVLAQITKEDSEKITSLSFEELSSALKSGELTAVRVLHAYQYQAAILDAEINFICEPFREAQVMAEMLDSMPAKEKQSKILFGIPISIKETQLVEGYDSTVGCVANINKPATETCRITQVFLEHGAVPFVRTNIPQTCMTFETDNPIYGFTGNPHDKTRTCGGSSGGEGAAVGGGASILGLGSDIGGSARIPAAWSGCYSLKPTAGRLSFCGETGLDYNERTVQATRGLMGRDVTSLIEGLRCLSGDAAHATDAFVPPIPFNQTELDSTRPLTIGYYYDSELIGTTVTSKRAVEMAVGALRSAGHRVKEWEPVEHTKALCDYLVSDIFADGFRLLVEGMKNDVMTSSVSDMASMHAVPAWIRRLLGKYLLRPFFPEFLCKYLVNCCGVANASELWKLENEIRSFRQQVVKDLKANGIDALVCPAMPVPAMKKGTTKDAPGAMGYLGYYNLLNFPSGIVPVTKVTSEDVQLDMVQYPEDHMWHRALKKNLVGSEGLPMAVQVVSLPYQEERCLRLMKQLESGLGYKVVKEKPSF